MKFRILKYTSLDTTNNNISFRHIYYYSLQSQISPNILQPTAIGSDPGQRWVNDMEIGWKCNVWAHFFYLLLRIRNIIIEYATCDQFRESMKKSTALGIFFIDSVRLI